MGMRFRKSVGNKFFRVNFSKSGVGCSAGVKGARVTKKSNGGIRTTTSIPGTGISYVTESGSGKNKNSGNKATQSSGNRTSNFSIVFKILGILLAIPSLLLTLALPGVGIFGLIISVLCFCAGAGNKNEAEQDTESAQD